MKTLALSSAQGSHTNEQKTDIKSVSECNEKKHFHQVPGDKREIMNAL